MAKYKGWVIHCDECGDSSVLYSGLTMAREDGWKLGHKRDICSSCQEEKVDWD